MVYTEDLKSFAARIKGSSPFSATKYYLKGYSMRNKIITFAILSFLTGCNFTFSSTSTNSSETLNENSSTGISVSSTGNSSEFDFSTTFDFESTSISTIDTDFLISSSTSFENSTSSNEHETHEYCGDFIIHHNEECDDGNTIDNDDCSNDCFLPRRVFVTKELFTGNLGGIEGANSICQKEAEYNNVKGIFVAYLGDTTTSPAKNSKFTSYNGWYKTTNGIDVVKGWNGLLNDLFLFPINRHADGNLSQVSSVWTNIWADSGTTKSDSWNCLNWTSNQEYINNYESNYGRLGFNYSVNSEWVDWGYAGCHTTSALYCFQIE